MTVAMAVTRYHDNKNSEDNHSDDNSDNESDGSDGKTVSDDSVSVDLQPFSWTKHRCSDP